jgi:hypothetical protein
MKNKDIRLKIFQAYSQNLEWLKENPKIKLIPDYKDGYICPICTNMFNTSDLSDQSNNQLTIEHVPPESLGGKPKILTCKKCNSKSGHELDNQLQKKLLQWDFNSFLPNSKINTQFELNGNKVNGNVDIYKDGVWKMNFRTQHSNPKEVGPFLKNLFPAKTIHNPLFNHNKIFDNQNLSQKFSFSKKDNINVRYVEVATLRIAYLYAYSTFGNSLLLNPSFTKVRQQIMNPQEIILPRPYWIQYDFSDEWVGVNFIREPKELRCLLVVFNLKTKSKTRRFAIALPGPNEPGIEIYNNISKKLGTKGEFQNVTIDHIADDNFIKNKTDTFAFQEFWNGLNK